MPCRLANPSALPPVGDATATTSISSGIALTDAAIQSAWKREPMIPILTLDTRLRPSRLIGLQWYTPYPFAGRHDVPQCLRHADLGRKVGLQRQLANEREVMLGPCLLRFGVDLAQELLALVLWQ